MINNFHINVTSWFLVFTCAYWYLGMSIVISVMRCNLMPMLHNGLPVDSSVHQWFLALVRSIISSPWILRVGLHNGSWSWTMEDGLFQWSSLMVNLLCSDFLKNQFTKPLSPSLGVNQMWTKKNDHAPKSEGVDFFNTCPKRAVLKKIQVWPFSCLFLGFTCLHFLLNVSKMWLANLLTTIFTKKMSDLICTCSM